MIVPSCKDVRCHHYPALTCQLRALSAASLICCYSHSSHRSTRCIIVSRCTSCMHNQHHVACSTSTALIDTGTKMNGHGVTGTRKHKRGICTSRSRLHRVLGCCKPELHCMACLRTYAAETEPHNVLMLTATPRIRHFDMLGPKIHTRTEKPTANMHCDSMCLALKPLHRAHASKQLWGRSDKNHAAQAGTSTAIAAATPRLAACRGSMLLHFTKLHEPHTRLATQTGLLIAQGYHSKHVLRAAPLGARA